MTRKWILCFAIFLAFAITGSAQDTYALKLGGPYGGSSVAMITTADGGNLLLFRDRLRKIDASGKKVWQRKFHLDADSGFTRFSGDVVAQLSDGSYILAGTKIDDSIPVFGPHENLVMKVTASGKMDWEIAVRVSSSGSVVWKKRFNVNGKSSQGLAVTQTVDGGFAITGRIGRDGFIAQLSPDGKALSTVRLDAGRYDNPNLILPNSDGGYIVHDRSEGSSFLLRMNSKTALSGCLFQPATSVPEKFGRLEVLDPEITTSSWNPEVSEKNDVHSRKYRVHDSKVCK